MSIRARSVLRLVGFLVFVETVAIGASLTLAQEERQLVPPAPARTFPVDGQLALSSLIALTDGHLQKTADVLTLVASADAVRSGDWERIRGPLAEAARVTVPAVHWFARPDGRYWTLEEGRASGRLSDRPYFSRVLSGHTVIGELVVSRSTNRNTAIVAVPVRGPDGSVIGVLGSSVQLDRLSALIREELRGLEPDLVFFAIDSEPLGAIHSDPGLIFTDPMRIGDEGMRRAFTQILSHREGVVTYDFRGSRRTVLYRRSPVTQWWYGFGELRPITPGAHASAAPR